MRGREIQKIKTRLANRAVKYGDYKRDSAPLPSPALSPAWGPPAATKVDGRTKEARELKKRKINKLNSLRLAPSSGISASPIPVMLSTARSIMPKKRLGRPSLEGRFPMEAPRD